MIEKRGFRHVLGLRTQDLHAQRVERAHRQLLDGDALAVCARLAIHQLGHALLHFLGRRAGPHRVDDDHLDGERRIFRAAEPLIREEACDAEHHDEEQDQRRVRHGPGGKIESLHRTLGMSVR